MIEDVIQQHGRAALSFSGGKDSLACVHLLRPHWDRITIYHGDTGDLLPETVEIVRQIEREHPRFVRVTTDVIAWQRIHGLPSDLVPYGSHPIGRAIGEAHVRLVSRYDCCFQNLMQPLLDSIRADGHTLLIRGTKRSDMPRLPLSSGETLDGMEVLYPLQEWSDGDVLAYLRSVGAPVSRVYETATASLDCARCTGWWNEGRGAYLRMHHPILFAEYQTRFRAVASALHEPLRLYLRETSAAQVAP